jgi:hypothetical protein
MTIAILHDLIESQQSTTKAKKLIIETLTEGIFYRALN